MLLLDIRRISPSTKAEFRKRPNSEHNAALLPMFTSKLVVVVVVLVVVLVQVEIVYILDVKRYTTLCGKTLASRR